MTVDATAPFKELVTRSANTLETLLLVYHDDSDLPESIQAVISAVGPNIYRMRLDMTLPKSIPTSLSNILWSLKGLQSLQLKIANYSLVLSTLQASKSCRLVHFELTVERIFYLRDRTAEREERGAKILLQALEYPVLGRLKRWRVHSYLRIDTTKGIGKVWRVKCEERGIEVRDEKRYFTG